MPFISQDDYGNHDQQIKTQNSIPISIHEKWPPPAMPVANRNNDRSQRGNPAPMPAGDISLDVSGLWDPAGYCAATIRVGACFAQQIQIKPDNDQTS